MSFNHQNKKAFAQIMMNQSEIMFAVLSILGNGMGKEIVAESIGKALRQTRELLEEIRDDEIES